MELTTQRLRLRDFQPGDWEALLAFEGDAEAVRYQSYEPKSANSCKEYLANELASRSPARRTYDLAVVLPEEERLIGRVGLDIKTPENSVGELWFILDRAFWGRGLMPEAARGLMEFGFRDKKLHRIFLECDPRNVGAMRLAEKVGMKREGVLREHGYYKGEWCDCMFYGVLAEECHYRP